MLNEKMVYYTGVNETYSVHKPSPKYKQVLQPAKGLELLISE